MNTNFQRPTAKIYQFPLRDREVTDRRQLAQKAGSAHYISNSSDIMITGAWYHDAAIKDDDRNRKG